MDAKLATTLVEQSPDALIYAGKDGIIGVWNTEAERLFGYTESEALGQSLDIIIPDQFREAHWTGYDRALGNKVTKYKGQALTTRAQRKGGDTIYVDLGFAIVLDDAGEPIGAMATARDVTERFQHDRETRRELRELKAAAAAQG